MKKPDYTNYGPEKVAIVPVAIKMPSGIMSKRMAKIPYGSVECVLRSIALMNDSVNAKEHLEDMVEICLNEISKL